jgi:glycosyltransferase involved in cell wall biosynthesis
LRVGIYAYKYHKGTWGGLDGFFVESTKALATHQPQHEYIVLSQPGNTDEIRAIFAGDDVEVHCLNNPMWLKKLQRAIRRALPGVRTGQAAQIDALGLDVVSFPRQILQITGIQTPVTLTLFDIQHEYMPQFFAPDVLAHRQTQYSEGIIHSDMLLVSTDYTQSTVAEKYPQHVHKVRRVYPGMERDEVQVSQSTMDDVRAAYHLPDDFILYPANPWPHKNHARLFAALRRLRDEHQVTIPVVLTGRLEHTMPYHTQQIAIAADINALFVMARCMVMPSLYEGFGFPVLEAQLSNCPVGCSNTTTFPEIAGDGALLFNPLDTAAIADAIWQLWTDADLRTSLIERGHRNAKRFSWKTYAEKTIAAFEELIAQKLSV